MSRPKSGERVELKYCEGCGALHLRPVGSGLVFCRRCEAEQTEERVFLAPPQKKPTRRQPRLPRGVDLQGCADPRVYSGLGVCA